MEASNWRNKNDRSRAPFLHVRKDGLCKQKRGLYVSVKYFVPGVLRTLQRWKYYIGRLFMKVIGIIFGESIFYPLVETWFLAKYCFSKVFTHKFTRFNWTRKIVHSVRLGKIVFRVRIELFCAMQVLSNQLIDNFPWIHKNKFDMETKIGFQENI